MDNRLRLFEFLGQRGAPGVLEQQRGAASDVDNVVQGHDPFVVLQPGQHCGLGAQPFGGLVVRDTFRTRSAEPT